MTSTEARLIIKEHPVPGPFTVGHSDGTEIKHAGIDLSIWVRAQETYRRWLERYYNHLRSCEDCMPTLCYQQH